jgi:hypothetical protein
MRHILILIFYIICSFAYGQKVILNKHEVYAISTNPEYISFSKNKSTVNISQILKFLESRYLNHHISDQKLETDYVKTSPIGTHCRFKHQYNGLPVFGSYIQANFDHSGNLYLIMNGLAKFYAIDVSINIPNKGEFWMNTNVGLTQAYKIERFDSSTNTKKNYFYNNEGKLLMSIDPRLYFNSPDSMVSAMVYLPNPIVARNANYGGGYVDNNDKNTLELTNARDKVRVPLLFKNGKFILSNGLITLTNLHDPMISVITPTDTFLNYTRDQSGFEDINVFYHLNNYSHYLKKIGFGNLLDTILVDSHGANGDDNSFLDPGKKPLELEYGTGNVDDAEDGQVVVHEFGHSFSVIASPNTVKGNERIAMEEGQADYVCMSYSRSLSKNKPYDVFSWDGHNQFWDGFNGKTTLKYKSRTGVKDVDRNIWSTALLCIHDKLRSTKCDSLVYSYYFLQSENATMPQMAKIILKIDSLLFNARELDKIWQCFTDQEILDTVPKNVGIQIPLDLSNEIKVLNTDEFSRGIGVAKIVLEHTNYWGSIEVVNYLGQTIENLAIRKEIPLDSNDYGRGVYYLKFKSIDLNRNYYYKLLRF